MAGPVASGPVLAVSRGGTQHDRRVHLPQRRVADAQSVGDARTEALDDHIGTCRQRQERLAPFVILEVEQRTGHAPVARVCEVGRCDLHSSRARHRTYFGDRRAVVRKDARGTRRRTHRRQVEYPNALERRRPVVVPSRRLSHSYHSLMRTARAGARFPGAAARSSLG